MMNEQMSRAYRGDETIQLPPDNETNESRLGGGPQGHRWRVFTVLLLSMLVSYAPMVYGRFTFVEGGVSKNDLMYFILLPFLSLILMLACVLGARAFGDLSAAFSILWLGKRKRSDILGAITLVAAVISADRIFWYIFGRLHIPATKVFQSGAWCQMPFLLAYTLRLTLVTPFVEEVFWRGYVQDSLQKTFNWAAGLLVQAVLFALLHLRGPADTLTLFIFGLILGIWRWRKRTLIPLIVAHMVFNSLGCSRFLHDLLEVRMIRNTHNYGASLEVYCRPPDYTPNENALGHYSRAFELVVKIPKELGTADLNAWPTDLSAEKIRALRNWISCNQQAIAELEAGAQKRYYIRDYRNMSFEHMVGPPFRRKAREIVLVLLSRAQISATEGNHQQSVSDIITCYCFGRHLMGPKPLNEQLMGLGVQEHAVQAAFRILERVRGDAVWLGALQVRLEAISDKGMAPLEFAGERLICHDSIQKTFTDDGTGGGHIPRSVILDAVTNPRYARPEAKTWTRLDRRRTTQLTDRIFAYLDSIKDCTPVELNRTGKPVQSIIREAVNENDFLLMQMEGYGVYYYLPYQCKALKDALIVTSAIMRYQIEQGALPDELDQLVRAGYLGSLPVDPFSDSPFVYRKEGRDFLLYSLGPDFNDDGGTRSSRKGDMVGVDDVFWPLKDNQAREQR